MASRRLPLGLGLFLLFHGLYGLCASGRVERVPDEYEVYLQVEGLWDRGTQAMPPWIGDAFFGRRGRDDARYAPYGPGLAFAALPHHALGRGLAAAAGVDPPRLTADAYHPAPSWTGLVAGCTSWAAATWAALAVWGLFAAGCALGGSRARAAWVAGLLGVASLLFPYGTLFFSEPLSAALLIWALAWHLRDAPVPAALCMLGLGVIKATNLFYAPALLCLAIPRGGRRPDLRRALLYGVALVAAGLIHMEWNRHRFGNPLEFGYDWSETIAGRPRPFDPARLPTALFGLLLSPGKSVFLFTPALVLVLAPSRLRALVERRRDLAQALGVATLTAFAVYGTYMFWEGGYCPGPRHLVPLLPAWLLVLNVGPRPGPTPGRVCLVGGAALALLVASVSYLEDQALGGQALTGGPRQERYYRIDDDPDPGDPANVYQLGYSPLTGYPPRLWGHLTQPATRVGEGLEFFRAHLSRIQRSIPGAQPLPGWLVWLVGFGWGIPFGVGLAACWGWREPNDPETAQLQGS